MCLECARITWFRSRRKCCMVKENVIIDFSHIIEISVILDILSIGNRDYEIMLTLSFVTTDIQRFVWEFIGDKKKNWILFLYLQRFFLFISSFLKELPQIWIVKSYFYRYMHWTNGLSILIHSGNAINLLNG